jgi:hypothetical protein
MAIKILSAEELALRAQLVAMNPNTLVNSHELVTGLSLGALANRRAASMWPQPLRLPGAGRLVRYRLGHLLAPPEPAGRDTQDGPARMSTINP